VPAFSAMRSVLRSARRPALSAVCGLRASWLYSGGWTPASEEELARMSRDALIYELGLHHQKVSKELVPWFLKNMPAAYFRQNAEKQRLEHLRAISSLYGRNGSRPGDDVRLSVESELPDGRREYTIVRPGAAADHALEILKTLQSMPTTDTLLRRVKLFEALDQRFTLYIFEFDPTGEPAKAELANATQILEYADNLSSDAPGGSVDRHDLEKYIRRCTPNHVSNSSPARFLYHKSMYDRVVNTDEVTVSISEYAGEYPGTAVGDRENKFWIDCAMSRVIPMVVLRGVLRLLTNHDLHLIRVHVDMVSDHDDPSVPATERSAEEEVGGVTLLRLLVADRGEAASLLTDERGTQLTKHLERMKWYDERVLKLALDQHPWLGLDRAEIIVGLLSMLHGPLHKTNPWAFLQSSVFTSVAEERKITIAARIADLFLDKFHPDTGKQMVDDYSLFQKRAEAIHQDIQAGVATGDPAGAILLEKMLEAVDSTLRTNVHRDDRFSLSLRLRPDIMNGPNEDRENPYGVFFVTGRRFSGFHVRFRDIARGGMRLVTPRGPEAHSFESSRQYDEAYGLAFAQQLKNKDIPEGGSKAVCLVDTHSGLSTPLKGSARSHSLRKSVKAMTDGILDLIVEPDASRGERPLVDYFGSPEFLYLGPDEQVIPEDIVWIAEHASKRGHPSPTTFMSSKPGAGINHKEFGVTSEGVNVYLAEALRFMGIEPLEEKFTISMTGGPDGDVAGNMLNIMNRDYGENVLVVGLADGSGCAEDPDGLDMQELLRLFREARPIADFSPSRLGARGKVLSADTEEGLRARNTMHFRVRADVFVPAGGRPSTVNVDNYADFITVDADAAGKPVGICPVVVEGANLFFTPEARQKLYDEAGVIIVKDSSANKTGVICSSYEICSSMLLSDKEFLENKPAIVADVLCNLRSIASKEAKLLFREFRNYQGSLPHFSERISYAINGLTDAIRESLEDEEKLKVQHTLRDAPIGIPTEEELLPLFRAHLPKALVDLAFDRVLDKVPQAYRLNAYASSLASRIVYQEGIHFVEAQPKPRLASNAIKYMRAQKELEAFVERMREGDISEEDKSTVEQIVKLNGVRSRIGL